MNTPLGVPVRHCARVAGLALCVAVMLASPHARAVPPGDEPPADPWTLIERFPDGFAVVGVVDEPSRFLKSEEGRFLRLLAGSTGLLERTARAWSGLASFYGADGDGVIDAFLSGRVALAIDWGGDHEIEGAASLARRADSRWVLVARVAPDAARVLTRRLEPVPRRIVEGVPIYSIEKGRFSLVVRVGDADATLVMLAPRGAGAMLERVVRSFSREPGAPGAPIPERAAPSERLVSVRLNTGALGAGGDDGSPAFVRVALDASESALTLSAAAEMGAGIERGRAPIGLLDAPGEDAIGVIASAGVLGLTRDDAGGFSVDLAVADPAPAPVRGLDRPEGVMLALWEDRERLTVGVLTRHEPGAIDAADADAWMRGLIASRGPDGSAPSFGGRFPGAVRTTRMRTPDPERGADGAKGVWAPTGVSWRLVTSRHAGDLVIGLGDDPDATARRVETLARAGSVAGDLGPDAPPGSELVRGWVDPVALISALDAQRAAPARMLAPKLGRLGILVTHDGGVVRGRLRLELEHDAGGASVGSTGD